MRLNCTHKHTSLYFSPQQTLNITAECWIMRWPDPHVDWRLIGCLISENNIQNIVYVPMSDIPSGKHVREIYTPLNPTFI